MKTYWFLFLCMLAIVNEWIGNLAGDWVIDRVYREISVLSGRGEQRSQAEDMRYKRICHWLKKLPSSRKFREKIKPLQREIAELEERLFEADKE